MSEENNKRPTSFGEAAARMQMGGVEAASDIAAWYDRERRRLQELADAAADESKSKGFWGKLMTLTTTLGCAYVTGGTAIGECVALGTAAGAVTKGGIDLAIDSETGIREYDPNLVDVKYYRNQMPELRKSLDDVSDDLNTYIANEWKTDVLKTLNDTFQAYQWASGLTKLGAFDPEKAWSFESLFGKDDAVFSGTSAIDTQSNIGIQTPNTLMSTELGTDPFGPTSRDINLLDPNALKGIDMSQPLSSLAPMSPIEGVGLTDIEL